MNYIEKGGRFDCLTCLNQDVESVKGKYQTTNDIDCRTIRLERYAWLVVCMRREGLIGSVEKINTETKTKEKNMDGIKSKVEKDN